MATIRLERKNKSLKIVNRKDNLKLQHTKENISLEHTGKRGPQGEPGEGLPLGGDTGEILVKLSDADNDYGFASPNDLADKNYVQTFTVASTVTVNHNLNKLPAVTIIDSAESEVIGDIEYTNNNTLVLTFSAPFSGKVTCN